MTNGLGSWARYAPEPRNRTFEAGLRGQVHDPLWLLARQWQLRELHGSDAGTPIDVDLTVTYDDLESVSLRGDGVEGEPSIPYDGGPLEPLFERETAITGDRPPGARIRVETGRQFRLLLASEADEDPNSEAYDVSAFPSAIHLVEPTQPVTTEDRRFFQVMAGRALDGYEVYQRLVHAVTNLEAVLTANSESDETADGESDETAADGEPDQLGTAISFDDERDEDGVLEGLEATFSGFSRAAASYIRWYRSLYDEPNFEDGVEDEDAITAWRSTRFEYDGSIETESGVRFDLAGYAGGRLDRDNFVLSPDSADPETLDDLGESGGDGADAPASNDDSDEDGGTADTQRQSLVDKRLMPDRIDFPGMPSKRWWSFTEASIAVDDLSGAGTPLPYLLVLDYAVEYGADWFSVPINAPLGTFVRVAHCSITDTFGIEREASPVVDDNWQLYMTTELTEPGLLLPPTLSASESSEPVESVLFGRDEMANLVFALEERIEGPTGRSIDRTEFQVPELVVETIHSASDPDEEYVTFTNPGEDYFDAGTAAVRAITTGEDGENDSVDTIYTFGGADAETEDDGDGAEGDGESEDEGDFADGLVLAPGETIRLYTGSPEDDEADDVYAAGRDEPVWEDADALDVVDVGDVLDVGSPYADAWEDAGIPDDIAASLEDAEDVIGVAHDDGSLLTRRLLSRPDASGAYRLVTSVPPYWFPFEMEYLGGVDDEDDETNGFVPSFPGSETPIEDALFADPDGYILTQALLLDAESIDAGLVDIPRPLGSILDPQSAERPDVPGHRLPYWMYEEEVTRAGREVERRYQLARWGDGSVHLWSERQSRVGVGELASGLRFDILDE